MQVNTCLSRIGKHALQTVVRPALDTPRLGSCGRRLETGRAQRPEPRTALFRLTRQPAVGSVPAAHALFRQARVVFPVWPPRYRASPSPGGCAPFPVSYPVEPRWPGRLHDEDPAEREDPDSSARTRRAQYGRASEEAYSGQVRGRGAHQAQGLEGHYLPSGGSK
jgi:hypothetical protein